MELETKGNQQRQNECCDKYQETNPIKFNQPNGAITF